MGKGNKSFHHQKNQNPAVTQLRIQQNLAGKLKDSYDKGIVKGCLGFEVMSIMVLHDKFNMTAEEIKQFAAYINDITDSVNLGYCTISDMIKALHDEEGFTMTEDQLAAIDPALVKYMNPQEN